MNQEGFFDRFNRLLENTKEKNELETKHDALIMWFGEYCLGIDPEDVKDRIVSDKHAEGVDSILVDQRNYKVMFIQAKTVDTFANTRKNFPENALKTTLDGIRFLMKSSYKGKITPELENLIDEFHELDRTGNYKTEVIFLALRQRPVDYKFIVQFHAEFSEVNVDFYDFDQLYDVYENKYLSLEALPPEKISFEVLTTLVSKNEPYKSSVFTCKGREIAKIYNDYKERILDRDLRYSLGIKSKTINEQILQTAVDSNRSMNFWYFNNGVTIVCNEITPSASGKIVNLKDAQIINGAQTTCALHEAFQAGDLQDDIEVLVKVIESSDKSFIQSVTLYTNFQNPIRLRDLCANDEIQGKTQKILLDSYGYFYDRKRGEFDLRCPTPGSKRELLGPQHQKKLVNNEKAAQAFLAMYLNKPAQAKNQKGRIFFKAGAGFYKDIFNENDDLLAEKILLSWKLLKYIETHKKVYNKKYRAAIDLLESESKKIYEYDFLLHSEYFILNILKDFLTNSGLNIVSDRAAINETMNRIEQSDSEIHKFYENIKQTLKEYISTLRNDPKYYHNKFFKNDSSVGLIRNFFHQKYKFVEIVG